MAKSSPPPSPPEVIVGSSRGTRVHPSRALVERPVRLARFFQDLGALMFGEAWKGHFPQSNSSAADSGASEASLMGEVGAQVLHGLTQGTIKTYVEVNLAGFSLQQLSPSRGRGAPVDENDDEILDAGYRWDVDVNAWRGVNISWKFSTAEVSPKVLYTDDIVKKSMFSLVLGLPDAVCCEVHVTNCRAAFRKILFLEKLPEKEWLARYGNFVQIKYREATAAAWRHLAIEGREGVTNAELCRIMAGYLYQQGLLDNITGTKPTTSLQNIAAKILNQLKHRTIHDAVFLDTSRKVHKLPKPQLS